LRKSFWFSTAKPPVSSATKRRLSCCTRSSSSSCVELIELSVGSEAISAISSPSDVTPRGSTL
jgi:hypothetical protein